MNIKIERFHSILKSDLARTQQYIYLFSESKDLLTNKAIKYIIGNRGKMLRPILLIISAKYVFHESSPETTTDKTILEDAAKAAALLELIQISSLIHDDVLDYAVERRNKSTLNYLNGNRFSILLGDYLVAQTIKNCYELAGKIESGFKSVILSSFLENISKLILGEIQQNNFNSGKRDKKNQLHSYFTIIENKTASLFSLACIVGSVIGGATQEISDVFKQIGHNIGMAYQIIDDLRDFSFSKNISTEDSFQDLESGVKSLPLILAFPSLKVKGEAKQLERIIISKEKLSKANRKIVMSLLHKTDCFVIAAQYGREYLSAAQNLIDNKLQPNQFKNLLNDYLIYLNDSLSFTLESIHCWPK